MDYLSLRRETFKCVPWRWNQYVSLKGCYVHTRARMTTPRPTLAQQRLTLLRPTLWTSTGGLKSKLQGMAAGSISVSPNMELKGVTAFWHNGFMIGQPLMTAGTEGSGVRVWVRMLPQKQTTFITAVHCLLSTGHAGLHNCQGAPLPRARLYVERHRFVLSKWGFRFHLFIRSVRSGVLLLGKLGTRSRSHCTFQSRINMTRLQWRKSSEHSASYDLKNGFLPDT